MSDDQFISTMFGEEKTLLNVLNSEPDIKQKLGKGIVGGTWMHHCAGKFSRRVLEVMVSVGFDPNEKGTLIDDFPIIWACSRGLPENVKFLLECGNGLDVESSENNPLFSAATGAGQPNSEGEHLECVRLVLEAGVDASVKYEMAKGKFYKASDWADLYGLSEMAALIRKYE